MHETATAPNRGLTVKQKTFKDLIEKAKSNITDILPKHLSPERLARTMLLAMTRQPLLYECSVESILQAFLTCAELGLEPGWIRGHMYLIPFWNSKLRGYECQTIPGYRGLMRLARNSTDISYFTSRIVYAGDKFQVVYGLNEGLLHEPCLDDNRGPAMCVYAVAHWRSGERQFEVLTRSQVESIKNRSRSRDKSGNIVGPWLTDEDEMWRKTAVRRLVKYMELSETLERAIDLDDAQYATTRGPERASVDMAGLLNAPQDRSPVIDLGQIKPAEPSAPAPEETNDDSPGWPMDEPPWDQSSQDIQPVQELQEKPKKAKSSKPEKSPGNGYTPMSLDDQANSIIMDLKRICGPKVNKEAIESHIGLPVEKWSEAIIQALEDVLSELSRGETPEDVFPGIFGTDKQEG
ncbi:MAG: recombinase RecT [Candidatus Omnitrophica bacterium]|nr:recombinase RecT [Candidatus Omnitrophota bacterium]